MTTSNNTTTNAKTSISDLTQIVIDHLSKVDKLHQDLMIDIEVNFDINLNTYKGNSQVSGESDNFINNLVNITNKTDVTYMEYRERIFDLIGQIVKYNLIESTFKAV